MLLAAAVLLAAPTVVAAAAECALAEGALIDLFSAHDRHNFVQPHIPNHSSVITRARRCGIDFTPHAGLGACVSAQALFRESLVLHNHDAVRCSIGVMGSSQCQ